LKKIVLLLIFLYGHSYAIDTQSTLKIYHTIFSALVKKDKIVVFTLDNELREVFAKSKNIILSIYPEKSDIVLVTNTVIYAGIEEKLATLTEGNRPIAFATQYHFLEEFDTIVGALYWRKGRSQLLFIKNRLDKYNITLPQNYQKFQIDIL
jgi:hypothetical protein